MTSILYIFIAVLLFAVLCIVINKKIIQTVAKKTMLNSPAPQQGLLSRQDFDRQLSDRASAGRFSRRQCVLLQLSSEKMGAVDLLVQRVEGWAIEQPFFICKLGEEGFAVLIEDVALPDVANTLKADLRDFLEAALDEGGETVFSLACACYPYDSSNAIDLWSVLAQRLDKPRNGAEIKAVQPVVTLREDGIVRVDYGKVDGVTYALMREAFQIYQDEIAPHYPGIKFPRLIVAERILRLEAEASNFARSPMMVDATSAIAARPQGMLEKHLMSMFAYYSQPAYPFKVCATEEQAIEWLQKYVDPQFFELQKQHRQASS